MFSSGRNCSKDEGLLCIFCTIVLQSWLKLQWQSSWPGNQKTPLCSELCCQSADYSRVSAPSFLISADCCLRVLPSLGRSFIGLSISGVSSWNCTLNASNTCVQILVLLCKVSFSSPVFTFSFLTFQDLLSYCSSTLLPWTLMLALTWCFQPAQQLETAEKLLLSTLWNLIRLWISLVQARE